jgi:hypothetical protein
MYPIKLMIFIGAFLLFTSVSEAKKRCKPLLEKLHNIQAMQRSGYSSQRGLSLRGREDKARDKWWQCEQGRGVKAKNKTKNKTKGKDKKNSKNKSSQYSSTYKQNTKTKTIAGTPFKTNNAIVIKSKYQGNKKQAWIKFYQQPTQCNRPKSLAVFASCSEDKQAQRSDFEQEYE